MCYRVFQKTYSHFPLSKPTVAVNLVLASGIFWVTFHFTYISTAARVRSKLQIPDGILELLFAFRIMKTFRYAI